MASGSGAAIFSFWMRTMVELSGLTMGIVGFGRIGRRVAEIADVFGMNVLAHNPSAKPTPALQAFRWASREEVFAHSDVVSLHCPLTNENQEFVNHDLIRTMKPSAILINCARGGLVNESDLTTALDEEILAGACLDVFSEEPITADNPLFRASNCLLSPHYAWATLAARKRLMQGTCDNVAGFIAGSPTNIVNGVGA